MLVLPYASDDDWKNSSFFMSKSRISQYDMCPLKFKKQYVDKTLGYVDTHATLIGSRFHEFAETFMTHCYKYPPETWHKFIGQEYTQEELPMLNFLIESEKERYERGEFPIALEYRIVNKELNMRGLIDRIDLVDEDVINVIEYKTSKSFDRRKLMMEFGFYSMLLDSIPELQNYKRKYTVINPRLQEIKEFPPSRNSTIINKINKINECIKTGIWKPVCKKDYALSFCDICTLEEIEYYNVEWHHYNSLPIEESIHESYS